MVMALLDRVTAADDRARPSREAPAPNVIAPAVMMVPTNDAVAPIDTAPVTAQKTFDAWASLTSLMVLDAPVLNAAPNWKMKTEFGLPWPSRVIVVDAASEIAAPAAYTPGPTVTPAWSPARLAPVGGRAVAFAVAVANAPCAVAACASPTFSTPCTTPGGNPTSTGVLTPRSPPTVVLPALVTVTPRTEYGAAAPSPTGATTIASFIVAASAEEGIASKPVKSKALASAAIPSVVSRLSCSVAVIKYLITYLSELENSTASFAGTRDLSTREEHDVRYFVKNSNLCLL